MKSIFKPFSKGVSSQSLEYHFTAFYEEFEGSGHESTIYSYVSCIVSTDNRVPNIVTSQCHLILSPVFDISSKWASLEAHNFKTITNFK